MSRAVVAVVVLLVVVAILVCLLVAVVISPQVAEAMRELFAVLTSGRAVALATVVGTVIIVVGAIVGILRWTRGEDPPGRVVGAEPRSTATGDDDVQQVRAEARKVARELQTFIAERDSNDPYSLNPGMRLPPEGTPARVRLDEEYAAYMDETEELYRSHHLEDVARVRDAFADVGVKDPELEKLYPRPRGYAKLKDLANRIIAMSDRR